LIVIAAIWLFRAPYIASDLAVTPDSVEYAIAPLELLETGDYHIFVQNRALPPRYPPWFSAIAILPAYVLFGREPGNAILPITLFAVAGIVFAWAIGKRIASTSGAILAALTLLALPSYNAWAAHVMTDVPCTTIMLGTCLLYLRVRSPSAPTLLFLAAGFCVGLATLFRPVYAAMLLPFVLVIIQSRERRVSRAVALLLPAFAAVLATVTYNRATFGSFLRNGYHFWTPVPADYPELTFSLSYVKNNVWVITHTAFLMLMVVSLVAWIVLSTRRRSPLQPTHTVLAQAATFFVLTSGPICLFHLFYFFPAERFYLPLLAGLAVITGSLLGFLINERWTQIWKLLLPMTLLVAVGARVLTPDPSPRRRLAADKVRQDTPPNAFVISAIDPVYLERMAARGSSRRIVPISRDVEYASKLIAPKRIDHPEPPPLNWRDHRALGLIRGGAQEAVSFVASEQIDILVAERRRGTPLFFDATLLSPFDVRVVAQLRTHFNFVMRAPELYELEPLD
jgi:4-amino-4-deoxy-L-arabinose transferase-like glycosyltransferase